MKILKYIFIIALSLPANMMVAMDCGHGHSHGHGCGGHSAPPAPSSPRGPQPGADNPPPAAPRPNLGAGGYGNSQGGSAGERIFVGVATSVAAGFIMALANEALKAWLHPENVETKEKLRILDLDRIIANTEHQIHILKNTSETTRDPLIAPECRKEIEKAERLFAQTTALRNQLLSKLMSNAAAKESLKV
jgi:hypothetical protein